LKISSDGYTTDADLFDALDKDLGAKFKWDPGPGIDGGTLHCESQSMVLNRTHSTIILSLINNKNVLFNTKNCSLSSDDQSPAFF
jgi:hypothetical protein